MFKNRVRLPVFFSKPQFPVEKTTFRLSNGQTKVLSMVIRNTYEGKTDQLPQEWHRRLVIALAHDVVNVEGERLISNVVLDGDYSIDWQDFLNYPIAQAGFNVEVTPFDATNSNCKTCEEMMQLNLVDDKTTAIWAQGTTNNFPDVLTDNDSICCSPFTIILVSFNNIYFTSVTISPAGVLTATVINPAPILNDVWVAKYRVTCPDGSYDEADVYANITGTDTNFCFPPVGPLIYSPVSTTEANISWDVTLPTPSCGFVWELYKTDDLSTILQSGTVNVPSVNITGLTVGIGYTVLVKSDCCGYDFSVAETIDFTITSFAANTCGKFKVTYLPNVDPAPQSISYFDCAGLIVNKIFAVAEEVELCMLIADGGTVPTYYAASSVDITINYISLC